MERLSVETILVDILALFLIVMFLFSLFAGSDDTEDLVAARCSECGVIGYYEDVPQAESSLSDHALAMYPNIYDFSNLSFSMTGDGIELDIP